MEIYIYRDGNQDGPYSSADIVKMIEEGSIKRNDLAWCDGCEGWLPLTSIPDLVLPKSLPPPPPSTRPESPQPIAALDEPSQQQEKGNLGAVALLVALIGGALNIFWVGSMNLLQNPGSTLMFIAVLVVCGTATLIGFEAQKLGMATAEDKVRRGKNRITSPLGWSIGTILLWVVIFPYYFVVRARYGLKNHLLLALILTVWFAWTNYYVSNEINKRQSEFRRSLEGWSQQF